MSEAPYEDPVSEATPTVIAETDASPTAIAETVVSPTAIAEMDASPTAIAETEASPTAIAETDATPTAIAETEKSPTAIAETEASPTVIAEVSNANNEQLDNIDKEDEEYEVENTTIIEVDISNSPKSESTEVTLASESTEVALASEPTEDASTSEPTDVALASEPTEDALEAVCLNDLQRASSLTELTVESVDEDSISDRLIQSIQSGFMPLLAADTSSLHSAELSSEAEIEVLEKMQSGHISVVSPEKKFKVNSDSMDNLLSSGEMLEIPRDQPDGEEDSEEALDIEEEPLDNEEDECGEEEIDPRIEEELESLNNAALDINVLEKQLDEARAVFRKGLTDASRQLRTLGKNLGNNIDKARPYFEAMNQAKDAQQECHKAAVTFERACQLHQTAREAISVAEEKLRLNPLMFDSAWQEMLNNANMKVLDAEREKLKNEYIHQEACMAYAELAERAQRLEKQLKKTINKARPYFEQKAKYLGYLEQQKLNVERLEKKYTAAKQQYATSLKNLEVISEEIHAKRQALTKTSVTSSKDSLASLPPKASSSQQQLNPSQQSSQQSLQQSSAAAAGESSSSSMASSLTPTKHNLMQQISMSNYYPSGGVDSSKAPKQPPPQLTISIEEDESSSVATGSVEESPITPFLDVEMESQVQSLPASPLVTSPPLQPSTERQVLGAEATTPVQSPSSHFPRSSSPADAQLMKTPETEHKFHRSTSQENSEGGGRKRTPKRSVSRVEMLAESEKKLRDIISSKKQTPQAETSDNKARKFRSSLLLDLDIDMDIDMGPDLLPGGSATSSAGNNKRQLNNQHLTGIMVGESSSSSSSPSSPYGTPLSPATFNRSLSTEFEILDIGPLLERQRQRPKSGFYLVPELSESNDSLQKLENLKKGTSVIASSAEAENAEWNRNRTRSAPNSSQRTRK